MPKFDLNIIFYSEASGACKSGHCGGAYNLPNNWYNEIPTDITSKTTPTNLAVSNSGDCIVVFIRVSVYVVIESDVGIYSFLILLIINIIVIYDYL